MISAYIKLSNFCNMGCSHCYLPESVRGNQALMEDQTFNETLEHIKELCDTQLDDEVLLLWHGGEPLQFDKKVFEKRLVQAENYFFSHGIKVSHGMQTALINFDGEWGRIIKRYFNSSIGVSVDPASRSINGDAIRYDSVLTKRIKLAQEMGITISGNVCPSKSDIGNEGLLLDWFSDHNISGFSIDRYNSFGEEIDVNRPSNKEHSLFLRNLLEASLERIKDGKRVAVCSTLVSAIGGVLNGDSGDRWGVSCLEDYIVVNPDGVTNTCPDKISEESTYTDGNGFVNSDKRIQAISNHKLLHPKDHCYSCEYFNWCKSGCPITINSWELEGECSGYSRFLNHVKLLLNTEEKVIKYYFSGEHEER